MGGISFGTDILLNIFGDIFGDIMSKFGYLITEIYAYCVEINQTPAVSAVCTFTMLLGAALCALVTIKQIIGTYGLGTEGDPDADPVEIVFRLCKAVGLMGMNSFLFTEMLKLSTAVGRDVTRVISTNVGFDFSLEYVVQKIVDTILGHNTPAITVCVGVIVIAMIVFGISAGLRGAELTLQRILMPIFCLDILNGNPEKWKMFIFQYGITFFSYIVQMFCFNMFIIEVTKTDLAMLDIRQVALVLGWLFMAIRTPSWLEKYIYATGTGRAISNTAGRIGQIAMQAGMTMARA